MVLLNVVHNKAVNPLDIDLSQGTGLDLKQYLANVFAINTHHLRILGFRGGPLSDDTKLSSLKVSPGQSILVLGVADADAMDVVDEDLSHHPLRQPGAGVKLEQFSNLFVALPREIQHVVLSHLPAATVAAAMRVCREWRAIVEHPLVWRHLFVSAFPFAPMARQFAARWREQYLGVLRAARAFKKKQFVELTIRTTTHSTAMSMHFSATASHQSPTSPASTSRKSNSASFQGTLAVGLRSGDVEVHVDGAFDRSLKLHSNSVTSMIGFGHHLISGDSAGSIVLWDLQRSKQLLPWSMASNEAVNALPNVHAAKITHMLADDNTFATCSMDSTVKCWDLNFIKPTRVFQGHTHGVYHCDVKSIAGASTHLTTAGGDGLVKIYDFRSCKAELTIWAHGGPTTRVQYLDNYTLLTSGHDGRLRMWDIRRPSAQLAKPLWFGSSILSFFYNGTTLITGTANALFCCSMGLNHLKLGVFDEEIEEAIDEGQARPSAAAPKEKLRPYQNAVTPYPWNNIEQIELHGNIMAIRANGLPKVLQLEF